MKKDDFGADIISISDEDGNNYELEHVDTIEVNGVYYLAFLPANVDEDSEDYALILLKKDKDDDYLVNLEEDEEERIYEMFMERLFGDEDDEDTEDDLDSEDNDE